MLPRSARVASARPRPACARRAPRAPQSGAVQVNLTPARRRRRAGPPGLRLRARATVRNAGSPFLPRYQQRHDHAARRRDVVPPARQAGEIRSARPPVGRRHEEFPRASRARPRESAAGEHRVRTFLQVEARYAKVSPCCVTSRTGTSAVVEVHLKSSRAHAAVATSVSRASRSASGERRSSRLAAEDVREDAALETVGSARSPTPRR